MQLVHHTPVPAATLPPQQRFTAAGLLKLREKKQPGNQCGSIHNGPLINLYWEYNSTIMAGGALEHQSLAFSTLTSHRNRFLKTQLDLLYPATQEAPFFSFFFSATISFSTSRRRRNAFALKPLQKINKPRRFESTNGLKNKQKKQT